MYCGSTWKIFISVATIHWNRVVRLALGGVQTAVATIAA